jgi:glycosyltransferase involved in cell wall biosynthesis
MFVNRRFEGGGAERQLIELAKNLDKARFEVCVTTFYEGGALYPQIQAVPDVRRVSLHKRSRWDTVHFLRRFWGAIQEFHPHIVIGYMTVANLLSLIVGKIHGAKVVWAVRNSNMDMQRYDWLAQVTRRLECRLSRRADLVIFNSWAGYDHYLKWGFPRASSVVIPNGINVEYFKVEPESRDWVRREWGVSKETQLIGLIGRLDPMKDHETFFAAAANLGKERGDVRFVCVGDGTPTRRAELLTKLKNLGLQERVTLVSGRSDMPRVYNALDIMSLSSAYGEGFPNVIGEAMACGVPCVVTDVGDAAAIVGDTGLVVPPRNAVELARKWGEMLDWINRDRGALSKAARHRIVENFDTKTMTARTESVLEELID